ncbi:polyhydroxyalkanoate synthase [Varunaivibrio sulfuroxidans]|uniref:Polyhydroxyalkanoate synthase n=2 Tax=Varunaivibrio sulfuroxidans TaxID=1773489 RepID=A0A4R3JCK1_9PROT|nr:polyhydroxyalkanoate synthase [Varunaivibrio sulfuroxidans]
MEHPTTPKHVFPIDRFLHAGEARLTAGLSPSSALSAYLDWAAHLANSPGKIGELFEKAFRKSLKFNAHVGEALLEKEGTPCIEPLAQDNRFRGEDWRRPPYIFYYQAFLLLQQWWHNATTSVEGVSDHHQDVVAFCARQFLDVFAPSNFLLTNPEALKITLESGGMNLVRGAQNFFEDWARAALQKPPLGTENFRVGKDVAITPGKVVYRNNLIEVIQYAPSGKTVHPEPVLIVPAWIMKYYILDLSPHNSLVKYLVDGGHTVFMISWKNPHEEDRNLGMDDYIDGGVTAALAAVRAIVPEEKVHAVGYCIGGTLLSIAAAALGRDGEDRLKSMTLFAAQTDFTEAGELMLFIDQSQIAYLEDLMWDKGYLDTKQMTGAFQMLRSNDLIWSRIVHEYLLGNRRAMIDLMAWNADATRMPYRMHSEYLRKLFLKNAFAEGHYYVGDKPATPSDIRVPIFAVGAEKDHVAPWKSVYKINFFADVEVTFLLTSGGHNAGIISPPDHPRRHHRIATKPGCDPYISPEDWIETTEEHPGSWWPAWQAWLVKHSGARRKPPAMGKAEAGYPPLCDAPGTYVLME